MSDYQIQLLRDDCLLADMHVSAARFADLHGELRCRFPQAEGFSLRIQHRHEHRRIVEQGPQGVRLLGIEYRYEEVEQHA